MLHRPTAQLRAIRKNQRREPGTDSPGRGFCNGHLTAEHGGKVPSDSKHVNCLGRPSPVRFGPGNLREPLNHRQESLERRMSVTCLKTGLSASSTFNALPLQCMH